MRADFTITEFTNSTALTREAATSLRWMETHESEVPFIPQIFGGDPGDMATAAEMLAPAADVIDLILDAQPLLGDQHLRWSSADG